MKRLLRNSITIDRVKAMCCICLNMVEALKKVGMCLSVNNEGHPNVNCAHIPVAR